MLDHFLLHLLFKLFILAKVSPVPSAYPTIRGIKREAIDGLDQIYYNVVW